MRNREGSYKKLIFETDELLQNQSKIEVMISDLCHLHEKNELGDQDFTTLYLLIFLRLKHPSNYLQGNKKANDTKNKALIEIIPKSFELTENEILKFSTITGLNLFLDFNLRGIPKSINRAMSNWYLNLWDIKLSFKIPTAYELLTYQVNNSRILTLIVSREKILTHILGKRDPLSFALHDLMHADQFFNNIESQKGQLGFYRFIHNHYKSDLIQKLCKDHPQFKTEFEYVVSDMNAYIIHLLKSFKSCFTRIHSEEILIDLLTKSLVPAEIIQLTMKLNCDILTLEEELNVKHYFESLQDFIK